MGIFSSIAKAAGGLVGLATGNPSALLSAGGQIAGALGQGKNPKAVATSKLDSLPPGVQQFIMGDVLPRMQERFDRGYEGIPLRPLNAEDLDPTFGSRARQDLQEYANKNGGLYRDYTGKQDGQAIFDSRDFSSIGRINNDYDYTDADWNRLLDASAAGFNGARKDDLIKALGGASKGRAGDQARLVKMFNELIRQYPTGGA